MNVFTEEYKGVFGKVCKKCGHVHWNTSYTIHRWGSSFPECGRGVYPIKGAKGNMYWGICCCQGENTMDFWMNK